MKISLGWLFFFAYSSFAASSFLDLCEHTSDKEALKTIAILQEELLGKSDGVDCDGLNTKLQQASFLNLPGKGITSLRPFAELKNLTALYLSKNKIRDLWPLEGLTRLLILDLSDNEIEDIGGLPNMPNLRIVSLDRNKIRNILPLKDLHSLKKVSLEDNPALTEADDLKTDEIRDSLNSLIFFRSGHTIADYAPLELNELDETVTLVNDAARRGDLDYLRALRKDEGALPLFSSKFKFWENFDVAAKKILIAVSIAKEIHERMLLSLVLATRSRMNDLNKREDLNIVGYVEQTYQKVQRAIEYFLMHDAPRAPFSFADKELMEQAFDSYIETMERLVIQSDFPLAQFKVFYSPRFVSRQLERFGKELEKNKLFIATSGF